VRATNGTMGKAIDRSVAFPLPRISLPIQKWSFEAMAARARRSVLDRIVDQLCRHAGDEKHNARKNPWSGG